MVCCWLQYQQVYRFSSGTYRGSQIASRMVQVVEFSRVVLLVVVLVIVYFQYGTCSSNQKMLHVFDIRRLISLSVRKCLRSVYVFIQEIACLNNVRVIVYQSYIYFQCSTRTCGDKDKEVPKLRVSHIMRIALRPPPGGFIFHIGGRFSNDTNSFLILGFQTEQG